jgi:NYN domain
VDIIAYAWDHPAPRTIVIISGDADLAYMIGTLRMRKYQVILISPNGTHASLTNQASVNLDWTTDCRRMDMDDTRRGLPSPHPPPSPHQFPSPSFLFTHYPKNNFLSKVQEVEPPMVELQGMPTARRYQMPTFPHLHSPDRFDIFGDLGGSFPSPRVSNGMFDLGDGRPQPGGPACQVRSDSAPPGIYSTHSPASAGSFGRMPSSAKGKQREFPITEPEDIGPQSPLSTKIPEEPRMAEDFFTSLHGPSAKMSITPLATGASTRSSASSQDSTFSVVQFPPSSTPTSAEPNNDNDNATERGKSPATVIIAPEFTPKTPVVHETEKGSGSTPSPRKEEAILTKDSPRASLPIQSQVPDPIQPSPTPVPPSQKAPPPKKTILNAHTGPSLTPLKQTGRSPAPSVPPHFQVLLDTLRRYGGSYNKSLLPTQLLTRDPAVYKKAQVSRYTPYIAAAIKAGLVWEVTKIDKGLCICLTEGYM